MNGPLDFFVAPNHRINLVFAGKLGQVARKALQHPVLFFRVLVGDARRAAHLLQGFVDFFLVHVLLLQETRRPAVAFGDEAQQQMLDPDVAVVQALGFFFGKVKHALDARRDVNLCALVGVLHFRRPRQRFFRRLGQRPRVYVQGLQHLHGQAVVLFQHRQQ